MRDLETALRELRVEWPATPDIAGGVLERIASEPAPAPARRRGLPRLVRLRRPLRPAVVLAWALLLAGGAVAAVPPARDAVLEFLGLPGARIERGPVTAPPPPVTRPGLGADLGLGERAALAAAIDAVGFSVAVPAALGQPDAVYVTEDFPTDSISLVYEPRAGIPRSPESGVALLVTVFRADFSPVIEKTLGQSATARRFEVDGDPAAFLSGAAHGFGFATPGGEFAFEEQRLAGDTLLLQRDDLLVRVEGRVGRARAVEIARSVVG